jgi:thioredoxin-related protein
LEHNANLCVVGISNGGLMKSTVWIILLAISMLGLKAQESVRWYTFEEAVELTNKEPRKIMVDVYTNWCGWCKVMDRNTFSHDVVASYLNEKYYAVKFNAEQKENVQVGGNTYKYVAQGSRGYHELAAALLNGKMAYPSVVFLDENVQIIEPVQGYIDAKKFDQILKFFGEDHYKTKSWETWQANYDSPIEQ